MLVLISVKAWLPNSHLQPPPAVLSIPPPLSPSITIVACQSQQHPTPLPQSIDE